MKKNCIGTKPCEHLIWYNPAPDHSGKFKFVCTKHNKELLVDADSVMDTLYNKYPCKLNAPNVLVDGECVELENIY